ncbi:MAG: hypothetical protein R8M46_05155 [Ghiorsea sp.]
MIKAKPFMLIPVILLVSLFGIILNMSFSGLVAQPDWSWAVLLAVLLSDRKAWVWILPAIWFHDVALFWSAWVALPYFIVLSIFLYYADKRLGPGQPQRWVAIFLGCLPLFIYGLGLMSILLTATLAVWVWSMLSARREKVYVEPA